MQIEILKKFEGKKVRIILKNNFSYSFIVFKITGDNLLEFKDKYGEVLTVEPSYVSAVTEINGSSEKWDFLLLTNLD